VLDRRPDGYHLIDSVAVFTELADTLTAQPREEQSISLAVGGEFGEELDGTTHPEDNLVSRAAEELVRAFPQASIGGVRLKLAKRLPIASGLGGGSADAAAALRLLNRLWRLGVNNDELADMGLALGADVPACVFSEPVRVQGIGEKTSLIGGLPALPVVLVNPRVRVSTQKVYQRLAPDSRWPIKALPKRFGSVMECVFWLRTTRNDLYDPAKAEAPAIAKALRALSADPECLFARMSGSGGTVFGIFYSMAAAERAAARLQSDRPDWWIAASRTMGS
jgi:4-diphosphocytidyl-2-C-methyl-D-erythritol kinase